MLVLHHLMPLLAAEADQNNRLKGNITVVPAANPIGMAQEILGYPMGRYDVTVDSTSIDACLYWGSRSSISCLT